ncbi:MAG: hypothetical protein AAF577_04875 [Pseudomonadota bacterium]
MTDRLVETLAGKWWRSDDPVAEAAKLREAGIDALIEQFVTLGSGEPELAAACHMNGNEQLTQETVFRMLADGIKIGVGALDDIPNDGGATIALKAADAQLRALGASHEDVKMLATYAAYLMVEDLVTILDGSAQIDVNPAGIDIGLHREYWDRSSGSFAIARTERISGLHESWMEAGETHLGGRIAPFYGDPDDPESEAAARESKERDA